MALQTGAPAAQGLAIAALLICSVVILGLLLKTIIAIGEIICSPKFTEYVGMSAPPDKKALYMGFSNIPFAIGCGFAGGGLRELCPKEAIWLFTPFVLMDLRKHVWHSRAARI